MKLRYYFLLIAAACFGFGNSAWAQYGQGTFSGSFQLDGQYYVNDPDIGAEKVPEKVLGNGYFNLYYTNGNFLAGMRYENYTNPLLGFNTKLKGNGIPYRFITYSNDYLEVTGGNFYDQFGSGMIFRSYEDRQLGIDNSIDGVRIKLTPIRGLRITGIMGKMRNYWNTSESLLRAGDIDADINQLFPHLMGAGLQLNLGASIVSKYQSDKNPTLKLPENVAAGAVRANLAGEKFSVNSEFAYKANDPIYTNNYSYNKGTGLLIQTAYFDDGIGISLNMHRIDNFDFRLERDATQSDYCINYLPPISKQHTYSLAEMYPYSTQLNGEVGLQAEMTYTFPKNSFLGGKNPWDIDLNFSYINSLDTSFTEKYRYDSPFFGFGDAKYFQDLSIYASKKFSKTVKSTFGIIYQDYNRDVVEKGGAPTFGMVQTITALADMTFKLSTKRYLRIEAQHQWYSQDSAVTNPEYTNGNWMALLAEYSVAPHWFVTLLDEYNYDNKFDDKQLHYYNASIAYTRGPSRVSFGYGRQREGILCVGGVCRQVPAANGFSLSVTTNF